jgi:hypothetical protein
VTGDAQDLGVTAQRTRRNIVKMGVILGSAFLASAKASAGPVADAVRRPSCFQRGTAIQTVDGNRKVMELAFAIGDLLQTTFGGTRAIQWPVLTDRPAHI